MYFTKTPKIVQSIYKNVIWNIPNNSNTIYLTFDDGPTEEITGKTLEILKKCNVPATFFCLGNQVQKNPVLFQRIKEEGHSIGNHSFSHIKGWNSSNDAYINDVKKAGNLIKSRLFRPPYGKIKRNQLAKLTAEYKIVMWDVLPGDFSPKKTVQDIIKNTVDNVESGSIIVLHDNTNCGAKMNKALPEIISVLKDSGFVFSSLEDY